MDVPQLIASLTRVEAYPHPVPAVQVIQTHISVVFLAGEVVYKVKKPVTFDFLDFGTLEKRRHYCQEEVRLNRRLAPEVYLGVVPVTLVDGQARFEGPGEPVEWAVQMRRLPEEATLLDKVRRGLVDEALVEGLARRIAAFHQTAETNDRIAAFGRFDGVAKLIRDIYTQSEQHVGTTVSRAVFDRLRRLAEEKLERFRSLIDARAARGVPRDCHGDLHLDHIYHFPDRPPPGDLVIVDCIEFNERFRSIDPVADLAFAAMHFDLLGKRELGRAFVDAYFRAAGDEEGRQLLPMYAAYRATVRGSVDGLKAAEPEVAEADRKKTLAKSRAYWLLALVELEEPARRPCLLLVGGLPGAGKSTLAKGLAERAGFEVIRSDVVRKELAGLPVNEPSPPERQAELYSPAMIDFAYSECLKRAEALLFEGKRVIIDAAFGREKHRQAGLELAQRWAVPGLMLLAVADPETVRRRIEARRGDASDADWEVSRKVEREWEEPGEETRQVVRIVETRGEAAKALQQAIDALRDVGLTVTRKKPSGESKE